MNTLYVPHEPLLQEFVGHATGIENDQQAFCYFSGMLLGLLMRHQEKRDTRVTSVNFTRRMQLQAEELPLFYTQIRDLLIHTQATTTGEFNDVAILTRELSHIGTRVGTRFDLNPQHLNFFIALGQGVSLEFKNRMYKKYMAKKEATGQIQESETLKTSDLTQGAMA